MENSIIHDYSQQCFFRTYKTYLVFIMVIFFRILKLILLLDDSRN